MANILDIEATSAADTFLCCTCNQNKPSSQKQVVQPADPHTRKAEQCRCNICNALRSRVQRMIKTEDIKNYGALEGDTEQNIFLPLTDLAPTALML